jgi:hypothetical protein
MKYFDYHCKKTKFCFDETKRQNSVSNHFAEQKEKYEHCEAKSTSK